MTPTSHRTEALAVARCYRTPPIGRTTGARRLEPRARGLGRWGRSLAVVLLAPALALAPIPAGAAKPAAESPVGVAPGSPVRATPASACPSFHWGAAIGARTYELVVYGTEDEGEGAEDDPSSPLLRILVDGGASSWAPALDRCLPAGAVYGWSVRAIGGSGPSEWSPPLFFAVAGGHIDAELGDERLANALATPRRDGEPLERGHRAERSPSAPSIGAADATSLNAPPTGALSEPLVAGSPVRPRSAGVIEPPQPPTSNGGGPASLRVGGEVRTVDPSGDPRLWGEGRPSALIYGPDNGSGAFCSSGSIRYGLSRAAVDWGSAPAACPEGTWVCRLSEIAGAPACDTARPDTTTDSASCAGAAIDRSSSNHAGWLTDEAVDALVPSALGLNEGGTFFGALSCQNNPVWCCFD